MATLGGHVAETVPQEAKDKPSFFMPIRFQIWYYLLPPNISIAVSAWGEHHPGNVRPRSYFNYSNQSARELALNPNLERNRWILLTGLYKEWVSPIFHQGQGWAQAPKPVTFTNQPLPSPPEPQETWGCWWHSSAPPPAQNTYCEYFKYRRRGKGKKR